MGPKLCKTLEIRLECMGVCVCVYVWNSVLKGQNVLTIPFLFYSLLGVLVKIGVKCDIFFKITCVNFTFIIFQ